MPWSFNALTRWSWTIWIPFLSCLPLSSTTSIANARLRLSSTGKIDFAKSWPSYLRIWARSLLKRLVIFWISASARKYLSSLSASCFFKSAISSSNLEVWSSFLSEASLFISFLGAFSFSGAVCFCWSSCFSLAN